MTTVAGIEIHEVLHRRRPGERTRRQSHTVELPNSLVFTSASEQSAFCSAILDQYRAKFVLAYMPEAREAQEQAHQQTLQKPQPARQRAADERLAKMPTGTQRH